MLLWRLSAAQHAQALNGGYGLHFYGRWNTVGHAVTYCATSPALCVLEKLVHIEDLSLVPDLVMVTYELPDSVGVEIIDLHELPPDWRLEEAMTQQRGDAWHEARSTLLIRVPSVIVPIPNSPDANVLVNHAHPDVTNLKIVASQGFKLDTRLL